MKVEIDSKVLKQQAIIIRTNDLFTVIVVVNQ